MIIVFTENPKSMNNWLTDNLELRDASASNEKLYKGPFALKLAMIKVSKAVR